MESTQIGQGHALLPSNTRLGHVHLTVANLDRQIEFYTKVLAMVLHWREGGEAALGTSGEVLLRLSEAHGARRVNGSTGMYHFALLYPNRKELARAIARLYVLRYPNSPTDHGVSKTTYLDDAEGNNIELYVRSLDDAEFLIVNGQMAVRYADGRMGTGRDPLDVQALFNELDESDRLDVPLAEGTQLGHIHLYAAGLESSMHFYSDLLGFEAGTIIPSFHMGEVGLDAQQPHVVAFNTWKGEGIPPAPANALGIQYFTVLLPNDEALAEVLERVRAARIEVGEHPLGHVVQDPSQIAVVLTRQMLPV